MRLVVEALHDGRLATPVHRVSDLALMLVYCSFPVALFGGSTSARGVAAHFI